MHGGLDSELADRMAALVAQARKAGQLDALRQAFAAAICAEEEPAPNAGSAPGDELPVGSDSFPGRFGMLGRSPAMEQVFGLIEKLAQVEVSVLIQGETGTGKELVARALHEAGPRASKPLIAVNCAAIPAELLESELFGHRRGAFTGAIADRDGRFVEADGGTLFLDEIGDMPLPMQAKLLRVLQDGEVRRVGDDRVRKVRVRVVAATHKDLVAMCEAQTFREDLYFRLNVVTVRLPPLRERGEDLGLLVDWLGKRIAEGLGRTFELTPSGRAALVAHGWPGNIRELENELNRAIAMTSGSIGSDDLSPVVSAGS